MVAVVQLVEHQVVILGVAGSSPVSHPKVTHTPRSLDMFQPRGVCFLLLRLRGCLTLL